MAPLPGVAFASALASGARAQIDEQVAARPSPTVRACEPALKNAGALAQAICYRDELSRQDRRNTGSKHGASVLGRSAATGRLVLAPVSKPGTISLKQAKAAAANVRDGKK